ncbi:MAG: hypothetical protein HYY16_18210 [Planctomycetes bacterium]|nr:hypothetical protein [Planctomycetota bacterium]
MIAVTSTASPLDLLRPLGGIPSVVIGLDPCAEHAYLGELTVAALKCLDESGFQQLLGMRPGGRRDALYGRVRWLLGAEAAAWWDDRLRSLRTEPMLRGRFDELKVRANRVVLVRARPEAYLRGLPSGWAETISLHEPLSAAARLQIERVSRRPARRVVETVPARPLEVAIA